MYFFSVCNTPDNQGRDQFSVRSCLDRLGGHSRITRDKPLDADLDSRTGAKIAQIVEPTSIYIRFLNFNHNAIVASWLRNVNDLTRCNPRASTAEQVSKTSEAAAKS